jgi:nucleotide-binding universal stress UspA family protein
MLGAMSEDAQEQAGIVVGVDGSETSKDALRWAARQAKRDNVALRVISAWRIPNSFYGGGVPGAIERDLEAESKATLDEIIAEVVGRDGPTDITAVAIEGHPAPELVKASESAELLVVGNRGRGAFAGMLLGSISDYCVRYSSCPVVVVRHRERGTEPSVSH